MKNLENEPLIELDDGKIGTGNPKIKGPDNPTSQLLPIISMKGCSRDGERRLGERRR